MKVTFVANFMNHHQLPFSERMKELTNNNYTFIALEPIPTEQLKLGYEDMNNYDFVIKAYENKQLYEKAIQKILNDDVVIFGSCPNKLINLRMRENKLSILYTERFFKKGTYRRFIPITYYKIYDRILKHKDKNIKIICSSAYAPYDFQLLKCNIPIYKWGYFPKTKSYDIKKLMKEKIDEQINIVWVGRLIELKHAEDTIDVVSRLSKEGYNIKLNIIGTGILEEELKQKVININMTNTIKFLGAMSTEKVRYFMEKSNIFLFNSDFNEGWGAVVNEAMNSGCAVIASHAAGSIPFLIKDGINGLIYKSRDIEQLYEKLKYIIEDKEKCKEIGISAYETIKNEWNVDVASKRLYTMFEIWMKGKEQNLRYDSGPCSVAQSIDHNWY